MRVVLFRLAGQVAVDGMCLYYPEVIRHAVLVQRSDVVKGHGSRRRRSHLVRAVLHVGKGAGTAHTALQLELHIGHPGRPRNRVAYFVNPGLCRRHRDRLCVDDRDRAGLGQTIPGISRSPTLNGSLLHIIFIGIICVPDIFGKRDCQAPFPVAGCRKHDGIAVGIIIFCHTIYRINSIDSHTFKFIMTTSIVENHFRDSSHWNCYRKRACCRYVATSIKWSTVNAISCRRRPRLVSIVYCGNRSTLKTKRIMPFI